MNSLEVCAFAGSRVVRLLAGDPSGLTVQVVTLPRRTNVISSTPLGESPDEVCSLMLETITFPVVHCGPCGSRRLAAQDLDRDGELILVCATCGSPAVHSPMHLGASALEGMGYTVEGEKESAGCGSGDSGCGSCGKSSSCGV